MIPSVLESNSTPGYLLFLRLALLSMPCQSILIQSNPFHKNVHHLHHCCVFPFSFWFVSFVSSFSFIAVPGPGPCLPFPVAVEVEVVSFREPPHRALALPPIPSEAHLHHQDVAAPSYRCCCSCLVPGPCPWRPCPRAVVVPRRPN